MDGSTGGSSDQSDVSGSPEKYVLELQIWAISFVGGMLALALTTAAFFLYFLLIALASSVQVGNSITLGVTILITVVISRIVINRLWRYAKVSFLGISSYLSTFLPALSDIDPEHAAKECQDTTLIQVIAFGILSTIFTGFFIEARWTCGTANPVGGMTHAICMWFSGTRFLELQLYVLRVMYGSIGVGGVFFSIITLISLVQVYRGSILDQWARRVYSNFWVDPEYNIDNIQSDEDE